MAGLELALLESLYNPALIHAGYVTELVKKIVRDRRKTLDISIWEKILRKNKHHSSINRLYKIVVTIDPVLADELKALIKKVSYFI
ncbi:hypothetical protein KKG31_08595 [Patescibacteria group bacterium]|nr:hypothetical protein [Patescibacteria group bacterium]MBU1759113.1 hypothetical protein [Patescibacteria group bacterium]